MNKINIIQKLIPQKPLLQQAGFGFAPSNIALCKYWGKRDLALNLPYNSSLSISLADRGASTKIIVNDANHDVIIVNDEKLPLESAFAKRVICFLDLFRPPKLFFQMDTHINLPIAAGLASSACGFAALVIALNQLLGWQLEDKSLSILARLGSGSACRSLWHGFVEWFAGNAEDGMDSCAQPIQEKWDMLCIGLFIISSKQKPITSTIAMQQSVANSKFYSSWLEKAAIDFHHLKNAIFSRDFDEFGRIAESNALAMHAVMQTSWPPIYYSLPQTIEAMHKVWAARAAGLPIYFTQDAGPNLKLLFLKENTAQVQELFSQMQVIHPFDEVVA